MQIKETGLSFGSLNKRPVTSRIIIHHSASEDVAAVEIHQWHKNRGFSGIGYHYVIRKDGEIERGRPLDTVGAHAGEAGNIDSVGICIAGNFENYGPEAVQIEALAKLIGYLNDYYQKTLSLCRHKDISPTACPGKNFPWAELQERLTVPEWQENLMKRALEKGLISEKHLAEEVAPKWFVLAVGLNILEKIAGKA